MIRFLENFDLQGYNTFNIKARCKYFFEFTESEELLLFLQNNPLPDQLMIMGGGSNLLFVNHFDGLIIYPNIPGYYEINEDRNFVYLEVGAGVEWDQIVAYTVAHELSGFENLSLIPGNVGAAAVQNIGAYGEEICNRIEKVNAIDLKTGERVSFNNQECEYAYRNSIFKNQLKNRVVITSVVFKLDKFPEFNLKYAKVEEEAQKLGAVHLRNIRQAIINIRESKLPDHKVLGNGGSFFKNPVVEQKVANDLRKRYPEMPSYQAENNKVKLAAGWLIDQCGLKGYKMGDAGIHDKQALVLVNYGNATGKDIFELSNHVKAKVFAKFGIDLEPEVNIIK